MLMNNYFEKFEKSVLWFILLLAFAVKVPAIGNPLVGYFGSYQSLYGMMAAMMTKTGVHAFLIPQFFILDHGLPAIRLLDYPFAAACAAIAVKILGGSIDFWGRAQAALFTLGSAYILFKLAKKYFGVQIALIATAVYSFSPMALVSGISFRNESIAVFFFLLSILVFVRFTHWWTFVSGLLFGVAVVGRVHFLLVLPTFLTILWIQRKRKILLLTFLLASAIPVISWFGHAYQVHSHYPNVWTSIFMQSQEGRILFHPLLLSPLFYERLFEILTGFYVTPLMFAFLIFGFARWNKQTIPFVIWALSSLSVIFWLPQKVYDDPFYLISSLPAASILTGFACHHLIESSKFRKGVVLFLAVFAFCVLRYYIPPAFLSIIPDRHISQIGQEIQRLTQPNDTVIAQHGSAPDLLYYSNRMGWTFDLGMRGYAQARHQFLLKDKERESEGYGDTVEWLEVLRKGGAHFLAISNLRSFYADQIFSNDVVRKYKQVPTNSPGLALFDLRSKP